MISIFNKKHKEVILRGFKHRGENNNRVIFYQHGYFSANCAGPNRMFFQIAELAIKNNYDSIRVDMIGTGISDGNLEDSSYQGNLQVYQDLFDNLIEEYDEIVLVGHSMGTSYTLDLSRHSKVKLSIMISPSFGAIDRIDSLLNPRQLSQLRNEGFTDRKGLIISKKFLDESQNIQVSSFKRKLTNQLVFIYGAEDEMYEKKNLKTFTSGWINSEVYEIPDADHNFINLRARECLLNIIRQCLN